MYLGLVEALIIFLIAPFYISAILPEEKNNSFRIVKYYFGSLCSIGIGLLLASSYLFPFIFEYLKESYRGQWQNFTWSCMYQDAFIGAMGNLFYPFISNVHDAFGASALILIAAVAPILILNRVRMPFTIFFIWLLCFLLFDMTLGSNGILYYYFWKYFPFANTFRVPGRVALVLPLIMSLILVWVISRSCEILSAARQSQTLSITNSIIDYHKHSYICIWLSLL